MKRLFLMMICALMASASLSAQTLPDIRLENGDSKEIAIRSLVDTKPLIICFWSTTCKPCIQELAAINDQLADWRTEADFDVIAVSVDDVRTSARAKAFAKAQGWDMICLFDANQQLKRAMNVSLTPHSFVVGKTGNIVYSHTGYTPGSEQALLDKVIKLSGPAAKTAKTKR